MRRGPVLRRNSLTINGLHKGNERGISAIALFEYLNKSLVFLSICVKFPYGNKRDNLELVAEF
jgi:hypothetical protein